MTTREAQQDPAETPVERFRRVQAEAEALEPARREALQRRAVIEAGATIAQNLALRAGANGVTIAEIRDAMQLAGLVAETSVDRDLSWLSQVPRAAGLITTERSRPHTHPSANGRRVAVHVHDKFRGPS